MASLEPRGNSVRLNWRLGGSRDGARQSCTFSGPPEARNKLAEAAKELVDARGHNISRSEVYAAILGDSPDGDQTPTFRAWVDMWLKEREQARDIEPTTIKNYRWVLTTRVIPKLGHLRLTDIDDTAIRDWTAWMAGRRATRGNRNRNTLTGGKLSPTTIRKHYRIAQTCLGAAVPRWIDVNPIAPRPGSRRGNSHLPKPVKFEGMFLRPHEVQLILDNADPRIHDIVRVALATGLRLGELLALQVEHITANRTQTVVQVRQTLKDDGTIGPPKSRAGVRAVPVDDDTGRLLQRLVADRRLSAFLFTAPRGGLWTEDNFRKSYWWPAVAAAQRCPDHMPPAPEWKGRGRKPKYGSHDVSLCGCETRLQRRPRPHDLRHSHASALINAKWSPKKIQARLGHADYSTTMNVYAHLWDHGEAEELETAAALLVPARATAGARGPRAAVRRRVVARKLAARRGAA